MSDFSVMSSHAAIFTAGPPVVLESLGEPVTKEELGGPGVALASGLIHNVAPDDAAALELVRLYLSYFPSSAWSYPPDYVHDDTAPRLVDEILDIVPRDGRRVLRRARRHRRRRRPVVVVRGAARLRQVGGHRARAPRRPPGRGRRQPAAGVRGLDRRRRRRQGRALHHRRRLLPPAAGVPRRQPGRAARHRVGAARHPARRRAHVRGADGGRPRRSSRSRCARRTASARW